jgi:TonB family protein
MAKRLILLAVLLHVMVTSTVGQQKVFRISVDDMKETCLYEPPMVRRSSIRPAVSVKRILPFYPENARRLNVESLVVVQFSIDEEGQVTDPKIVKGNLLFQWVALDAVKQWEYRPSLLNGRATKSNGQVTFNFRLH